MKIYLYNYYDKADNLIFNPPAVEIAHSFAEEPLHVAIGLDPSSSCTGFTLGRVDMEYPIFGLEFKREKEESISQYIEKMMNYIAERVIAFNNISLDWVFTEDKFEKSKVYGTHTNEVLSAVKIGVKSLPHRLRELSAIQHKSKYDYMKPSEWRKIYLGSLNTNSKRKDIKSLVCNFTVQKYNIDYFYSAHDDLIESLAIYSSGFRKNIEPTLKNGTFATGDFNSIDWVHHINCVKVITATPELTLKEILSTGDIKSRIDKHGVKSFPYERGRSLERNIRALTSKSNSVYVHAFDTWDLEAVPSYYELKQTPKGKEKLVVVFYRKNII